MSYDSQMTLPFNLMYQASHEHNFVQIACVCVLVSNILVRFFYEIIVCFNLKQVKN